MISEGEMETYLRQNLTDKRFVHSLGVRDTAVKLAELYGGNTEKARIAGLVHDCAKNMDSSDMISIIKGEGLLIDEISMKNTELLHGLAGSIIARKKFGICDEEILSSIIYHTTGKEDMSLLEKIIYLSDYIEPSREFEGVQTLRELAFKDLDSALLKSFDNTIRYVILKGQLLHYNTIAARNYIIMRGI